VYDPATLRDDTNPNKVNEIEINAMRVKRMRETRAKKAIKEVIIYVIFIWVQFIVAYSKTDPNSYNYRARLVQVFLTKDSAYSNVTFSRIFIISQSNKLRFS
jgi:hypothetical protein